MRRKKIISKQSSSFACLDVFLAGRKKLTRIVAGMGFCPADGDDILQEVSIKALKTDESWQDEDACYRWLVRVTINECLSELRRRKAFKKHVSGLHEQAYRKSCTTPSGLDTATHREELRTMRHILQDLDKSMLVPLVLRYFNHMNSNEIAEVLELTPSAVRARLYQARLILAKQLARQGIKK